MHDRNIKLVVEYDGTEFAGWQVQPGERTVQGVLEGALSDLAGEETRLTGAGRTDAGVHALGQVANARTCLELPVGDVKRAINARLPDDVLVTDVSDVPASFHARFDATSRAYLYLMSGLQSPLWRRNRWFVRYKLDLPAMRAALETLAGEHDFGSFCLTGSEPAHQRCRVAHISLECHGEIGDLIVLRVTANRFLRGMVRSIVGTLVEVGRGRITATEFESILNARDRSAAGPTAPPWGLYLQEVRYDQEGELEDIPGHGEH
ncbi:MAG: tRNA pseudouridine(38-40) synthase TruA [Candidatus Eisenbacteria bacterium]|nr:tRNA pseudouridine(38-40) synthase TruA [Candidatus Eisenbacteria bacterium]